MDPRLGLRTIPLVHARSVRIFPAVHVLRGTPLDIVSLLADGTTKCGDQWQLPSPGLRPSSPQIFLKILSHLHPSSYA